MAVVSERRSEILEAALGCFTARGIAATTIADIRERAGATTGSVYHFFEGKDAIVGALYVGLLRDYQASVLDHVRGHRTARALVRGVVEHYLDWVEGDPRAARFLFDARRAEAIAGVENEIARANRQTFAVFKPLVDRFVAKGELEKMPLELFIAIVVGPAAAYAREWLSRPSKNAMARARPLLADAAWAATKKRSSTSDPKETA